MADRTLPQPGFFDKHADKIEYGAPSGCILWTAFTDRDGYGKVMARGKKRYAHREAYEAVHGAGSAAGLVVRHTCDTPACCSPVHLELGTHADNNRDMMERGRNRYVLPDAKGEANGSAKLNEGKVATIRADYVPRCRINGGLALARRFGVDPALISLIVRRKRWKHVA